MKLLTSPTSPYGRKLRMIALEKSIALDEELFSPWKEPEKLKGRNPLGKIPVLMLDEGTAVYDSWVIGDYLDSLGEPRLLPADAVELAKEQTACALVQGITDAATTIASVTIMLGEKLPDKVMRWHLGKIEAGLEELEKMLSAGVFGAEKPGMIDIATSCLLFFLEFRLSKMVDWSRGRPGLAGWYGQFRQRDSFAKTLP